MKAKQKLWTKLRALDRKIGNIPQQLIWDGKCIFWDTDKKSKLFQKLDLERKKIRNELKNIGKQKGE